MKQIIRMISVVAALSGLTVATQAQSTVYENNYNSQTPGTGFPAWNWADNGITTHTATYQDIGGGNIVVDHTGVINNTGASAVNTRFGSKWDITLAGNTSANAADYTLSFDVRNVSGPWDPYTYNLFLLTSGGNGVGYGDQFSIAQADGWVHYSKSLSDLGIGWWNGTAWDLTSANWSIEFGGPPWPGNSVDPGVSFTQVWQMDNLTITLVPEPSTVAMLLGGLGLFAGWRRYRRA